MVKTTEFGDFDDRALVHDLALPRCALDAGTVRQALRENEQECWLDQLMARTHQNVAVVALANKLVRMAWAVLHKNETYRAPALVTAT